MPLTCTPLGLQPSFGFGDRIGLATPGHVAAMLDAGAGIAPIFPQQSIREMTRTSRTPKQVMSDALSKAGAGGLFCSPSTLPAEVPAASVIAVCQYTPAAATATGGANADCSALGGNACRTGLCLSD